MSTQKYSVNQYLIESLLTFIKTGEIAIPEIQRPFVWTPTKVRDLMDSLYQGYPVGYIIAWKNPNVRLKDGKLSEGKKILIDGQQRVTALNAAILGTRIVNKHYKQQHIRIAFNPKDEKFEVANPAIRNSKEWIPDISPVLSGELSLLKLVRLYGADNPGTDEEELEQVFSKLLGITKRQVGMIELAAELDIETVTEIFIRINSKGVVLSQADFAMSKIASNETHGGNALRKAIDYFCHLAVAPEFFTYIRDNDSVFAATDFFQKMSWLKNENDDLYDPSYSDMLRVAFTCQFGRGRLDELVALLSGRNFETKEYEDEIVDEAFAKLTDGVNQFMNETNFKRFVMIIKSAGFMSSRLIRAQNPVNFAYILFLKLRQDNLPAAEIESYVRRWYVLSVVTGRYSTSPETKFDADIKQINSRPFGEFLAMIEEAELSDAFWNAGLVQALNTSSTTHPTLNVFLAAQVKANDRGLLSREITVREMLEHKGDVHHIYPREHLKSKGLKRGKYNQVANFAYVQSEINIAIGKQAPNKYFAKSLQQCESGEPKLGGIIDKKDLLRNLDENAIPHEILDEGLFDYEDFLTRRRQMMAQKIRDYYESL